MQREYWFYVYVLTNSSRRSLYIGFTSALKKRIFEHKHHLLPGFTDDYNVTRLVYFERYKMAARAIAREKQLKRWRRAKKTWLIERENPSWRDLSAGWFDETQGPSTLAPVGRLRSG